MAQEESRVPPESNGADAPPDFKSEPSEPTYSVEGNKETEGLDNEVRIKAPLF
jgi:hypothetical protein